MKKAIQFFLFFLMVLIAIVFYYNYLKIDKKDDNIEKSNNQSLINEQSNLIKNLKYEVKFDDNQLRLLLDRKIVYVDNLFDDSVKKKLGAERSKRITLKLLPKNLVIKVNATLE